LIRGFVIDHAVAALAVEEVVAIVVRRDQGLYLVLVAWEVYVVLGVLVVLVAFVVLGLGAAVLLAYHPPTFKYENIAISTRPANRDDAERICRPFVRTEYIPPGFPL